MKKVLSMLLLIAAVISLIGCGKPKKPAYFNELFEIGWVSINDGEVRYGLSDIDAGIFTYMYSDVPIAIVINTLNGDTFKYLIDVDNPTETINKRPKKGNSGVNYSGYYLCEVDYGDDFYIITYTQQKK